MNEQTFASYKYFLSPHQYSEAVLPSGKSFSWLTLKQQINTAKEKKKVTNNFKSIKMLEAGSVHVRMSCHDPAAQNQRTVMS